MFEKSSFGTLEKISSSQMCYKLLKVTNRQYLIRFSFYFHWKTQFYSIFGYLQIMPVNARDIRDNQGQARTSRYKAETSRDNAGTNRKKQGQPGTNRDVPFLSLMVPTCPCLSCLSMLFPACPCPSLSVILSLSVPVGLCMSLHFLYLHVYPCRWI